MHSRPCNLFLDSVSGLKFPVRFMASYGASHWLITLALLTFTQQASGWRLATGDDSHCYDNPPVGCFSNTGNFRHREFLPESPETLGVKFISHSSRGIRRFGLNQTQATLSNSFDPSLKTVIVIHGYLESGNSFWVTSMARRLKNKQPQNVFVVDWFRGASRLIYYQSAVNTQMVGAITALFLQELITLGASPSSFHLIGFSLGAQVAGEAGKRVPGVGRISGLDPAGPGFEGYHPEVRLDATDANFVDVLHTDANHPNIFGGGVGMVAPCGTVDFYPNGGINQPGCPSSIMRRLSLFVVNLDFTQEAFLFLVGCAHSRSYMLYSSSISHSCDFEISRCNSRNAAKNNRCTPCADDDGCPQFGFDHATTNATALPQGIYRFTTSAIWPYC